MKVIECLYSNMEDFISRTSSITFEKNTLIQVFTATLQKEEAFAIAKGIGEMYPEANVIGCSVGTVLFQGEQYENETLIVVEEFETTAIKTDIFEVNNLGSCDVVDKIRENSCTEDTQVIRAFFGNCYSDAHQFVECFNKQITGVKLVGGMAGDGGQSHIKPYVFTSTEVFEDACVYATLNSSELCTYSAVNVSHEAISEVCTLTKCEGSELLEINEQPASIWFKDKLGYVSTEEYRTWEEIATCDPLMRFQLQLEGHHGASRFVKYNHETETFGQYFTRIEQGAQFKLSYTSPAKCVDETRVICEQLKTQPVEYFFTYSCLMRKLFMQNCASWEISPFKKSNLSGIFLLGEFGAIDNQYNEFLNGGCVYSGLAEKQVYLDIDMDAFDDLNKIQKQEKDLLDFIKRKRSAIQSKSETDVLNHVIKQELARQDYKYKDENFNMHNLLKYEEEKDILGIDKICLIKIENAQDIIALYGQDRYFEQLKHVLFTLKEYKAIISMKEYEIHDYAVSFDTFLLGTSKELDSSHFVKRIEHIDKMITKQQNQKASVPLITRFVIVQDSKNLVEDAYGALQKNKDNQRRYIIAETTDKTDDRLLKEFEVLKDISSAIADNKVIPHYQGIRNNREGIIDKYEALIRIESRSGEILSPFKFLDIAKKHRLYLKLTHKMIDTVLKEFNDLDLAVTINVSYVDISSDAFVEFIKEKLETFRRPERLVFEILEDECFKEVDVLKSFISEVKALGAKVAIDDFGAGYSNLLEIIRVKPDFIKVDGDIIREIHTCSDNVLVLELITSLAKKLNVELIAEFVENEEIQREVEKHGIKFSQGYVFAKPLPFNELNICK